ncbi:hypothetical protein [Cytobacillus horneckiae]|uniref:Uncharacterized protein n=1 Tax=Cytobacillus horneckiae TaxID=549687 RepID=A0A2N0ZAX6_9BACI|nr:hypothetical protein [Cytobacillus horneckiae]MEC1158726.1 hypothetical protein [Cytobacillus horneckiae]NRG47432.1 hypothetical protein [Bacillus sp. CRN 9]PKG26664.1 hypothetical protein CWS20_22720 [Cytobacillus horneckiae]
MIRAPFIADKITYLNDDKKHTRTVFHPAVYFDEDEAYCYFPDEETQSGLIEYDNKEHALTNAETLYKYYVLNK